MTADTRRSSPALDLYDGADASAAIEPGGSDPGHEPAAGGHDWIAALWRDFPSTIRERYRPAAVIGQGGMGVVIEAEDLELRRVVAVKGLRDPASATRAGGRERQAREARLTARLTHPNILPVFDIWNDARGNPWCAMLRVPGESPTLARRLEALRDTELEARPMAELLQTFLQICRAIAYAHGRGVLHRDLKPENILIGPTGEALVADWGLAIMAGGADDLRADLAGTLGYAAPEQLGLFGPARSDERSDVYSLGILLFELVAGRRYGQPATQAAGDARPIELPNIAIPDRVPRDIARTIRRAAAWLPEERLVSVDALKLAVEAHLSGGLIEGLQYTRRERLIRWIRARPRVSATLIVLALLLPLWALTHLRDAARTRRHLLEASKFLARAETGWAAFARGAGQSEVAEHHLARAFHALARCAPGTVLPAAAYTFLAGPRPATRLVWACTLEEQPVAVRFGAAERSIAAAWGNGFLEIGLPSGKTELQRRLGESKCWGAALSPDRKLLATAGEDKVLRIWSLPGGELRREIPQGAQLWATGFGPDSSWIATGCFDGAVRSWDVATGERRAAFAGSQSMIWALAVSPDGRLVATGDMKHDACVWETASGRLLYRLKGHGSTVVALTFTPDSRTLATSANDGTIRLWNMATGGPTETIATQRQATRIAFSPDGERMAFGDSDSSIRIRSLREHSELLRLSGHTAWLYSLDFSADGRLLATGSQDRTLRIWDVSPEEPDVRWRGHAGPIGAMAFDKDGKRLATASQDRTLRCWNFPAGSSAGEVLRTTRSVGALAFDAGGALVGLMHLSDGVEFFDTGRSERRAIRISGMKRIDSLALDRGANRLAVAQGGGITEIFETRSARKLLRVDAPTGDTLEVAFGGDGALFATCGSYRDVLVYRTDDPRPWKRLRGHHSTVMDLEFSADGEWIASCGEDGELWLWNVASETGVIAARHDGHVYSAAFSADGRTLASGGQEGMIRIVRVRGAAPIASLDTGGTEVASLIFSPDGSKLVSAGENTPRVWDLASILDPAPVVAALESTSFFEESKDGMTLVPRKLGAVPPPRFPRRRPAGRK